MINIDLNAITASSVIVIPIIIAIVQAIKMTGWLKDKFAPLASIGVGVLIAFLAHHNSADLTNTILTGAMYGLMSSGLYSGVKVTMQANEEAKAAKAAKLRAKHHNEDRD